MAHVDLPEEELRPLIASLERVLRPIIDLAPAVTMIPSELDRIGDKVDEDMMSGIPDRLEAVHEKVTMDLGGKILAMQEKAANTFGARVLKIQTDSEKQRNEKIKEALIKSAEFGDKIAAQRQERLEQQLVNLQERGLAAEIKGQRVQFISQKDLAAKQAENLKTQKQILAKEKELQKLVKKGEEGSEDKISSLINEIAQLSKTEGQQSRVLGDKKKEFKPGIMAKVGAVAEDILPEPIMGAFQEFGAGLADTGKTLLSFGKPFMALGKVADKQFGITEKLQKLNVARYALGLKQFALEKLEFAMDAIKNIKNIAYAAGIAAIISGVIIFKDTIMNVINSIKGFFSGLKDSFLGKFMPSLGKEEPETPAQIEQSNVEKNVEAAGPLGTLAEARETGTEKLARLKGEAGEMMKERLATNIVNMVSDNTSQTSVAVNPTVPKSTSADALALNPTG